MLPLVDGRCLAIKEQKCVFFFKQNSITKIGLIINLRISRRFGAGSSFSRGSQSTGLKALIHTNLVVTRTDGDRRDFDTTHGYKSKWNRIKFNLLNYLD